MKRSATRMPAINPRRRRKPPPHPPGKGRSRRSPPDSGPAAVPQWSGSGSAPGRRLASDGPALSEPAPGRPGAAKSASGDSSSLPFATWEDLLAAPRSAFFRGHTADSIRDRSQSSVHDRSGGVLRIFEEALFTQSNTRVLIGQAANGIFRMITLPTRVYPLPTPPCASKGIGFMPGMYQRADMPLYAGNLSYRIALEGQPDPVDLAGDERDNLTTYADHFLPLTRTRVGELEVGIASIAPVAADAATAALAPDPLPGPPGAIYALRLRNDGRQPVRGRILLQASDLLVADYEDTRPELRPFKRPGIDLQRNMLILARPFGAVGIRLLGGSWSRTEAPFQAERDFEVLAGQELVVETHVVIGGSAGELMPAHFELCLRSSLEWIAHTAAFWRKKLGSLEVGTPDAGESGPFSRDLWIRCLLDNFNCLLTDAQGNLLAQLQGAPSHMHGVLWGIDVEPTVAGLTPFCPELAWRALLFFMDRSQAPGKTPDHSTAIYVAPLICARKWLESAGDRDRLARHPEVLKGLERIANGLLALRAKPAPLFPSRYSSDGPVGRRYDYATNLKAWYALDSFAFLLRNLGRAGAARRWERAAEDLKQALHRHLVVPGPFGLQYSGGTNLGEDPEGFYKEESELYYDGEDTSSMLAPIYGACGFGEEAWLNYHRFARSLWCTNFDPEHEALRWFPREGSPLDGTAWFSRLGGCGTRGEMRESLEILRERAVNEVTGSVHWWPLGRNRKNGLTRCSQGQGTWAWQYLQQWLGLQVDATCRTLTFAPRGLPTVIRWEGCRLGGGCFDLAWREDHKGGNLRLRNRSAQAWTVRVGFRAPGTGATGRLAWRTRRLAPGTDVALSCRRRSAVPEPDLDRREIAAREAQAFCDREGVYFATLGGAGLQRHYDERKIGFIRLLLLNGSPAAWTEAQVRIRCPEGWLAQWRESGFWQPPDQLQPREACAKLGTIPTLRHVVAPFWIKAPEGTGQAGSPVLLQAELAARSAQGKEIRRSARIEVRAGGSP